jgi:succinoglycan biosynthesis transport protein ExoP
MTTAVDVLGSSLEPSTPVAVTAAPQPPRAYQAEQYRVLSHVVERQAADGRGVIAISSPIGGDGKTTVSINLARALCHDDGSRVLLIDADLRRGKLAQQLGLGESQSPGLAGALADEQQRLEPLLERVASLNLDVLRAGACPEAPYEALRSPRLGALLQQARASHDCVLIDTPPIVPVADVRALSQWVDGFILIVTAHYTPRELVEQALSGMDPDKVVGVVFNGDDVPLSRRYRSYYRYSHDVASGGVPASLRRAWRTLLSRGRRP